MCQVDELGVISMVQGDSRCAALTTRAPLQRRRDAPAHNDEKEVRAQAPAHRTLKQATVSATTFAQIGHRCEQVPAGQGGSARTPPTSDALP